MAHLPTPVDQARGVEEITASLFCREVEVPRVGEFVEDDELEDMAEVDALDLLGRRGFLVPDLPRR